MDENEKIQELLIGQAEMKQQLGRIISDMESEKEVRKRRNIDIDRRLGDLEKWQAKWGGALITLGVIAMIVSLVTAFIKFN